MRKIFIHIVLMGMFLGTNSYLYAGDGTIKTQVGLTNGNSETNWKVNVCRKDRFTEVKSCSMIKGNIIILIHNGFIRIGLVSGEYGRYPNSISFIKIDGGPVFQTTDHVFDDSYEIFEQMEKGKIAYTRQKDWPSNMYLDRETDLNGVHEAYEALKGKYDSL